MKPLKEKLFDCQFLQANLMGPNVLRIAEELTSGLNLKKGQRILDLGCGRGLSSIFLALEFQTLVFAADLWISPSENYRRIKDFGLEDLIIPLEAEATRLPFAHDFFDGVVSIDSYHYFGSQEGYLEQHLAPLVKKGGFIAMATPGLKKEFINGTPEELRPFWQPDMNFHTAPWWTGLWERSKAVEIIASREMSCCREAWADWLACDNPYAIGDRPMIAAENGQYFNIVQLVGQVK